MMNPIQKNIADGMSAIAAVLTEATCGEACWHAREEVCRCSCGGKNHGCMKTSAGGLRPTRTCKIDGHRYELAAVGSYGEMYREAHNGLKAIGPRSVTKSGYKYFWGERESGSPLRVKCATKEQFKAWPELEAHRSFRMDAAKTATCQAALNVNAPWPYMLWRKI
jgi:hypothetical protein